MPTVSHTYHLVTREFFASVRRHLNPGGEVIVNVGHIPGSDSLEKVVSATLHAVFPVVMRDRVDATNTLLIASAGPLSGGRILASGASSPAGSDLPRVCRPIGSMSRVQHRWVVKASMSRRMRVPVSLGRVIPAPEPGAGMVRPSGNWSGRQDLNLRPPGPQLDGSRVAECV